MARTEKVIVRLTKKEKEKIEKYAKYLDVSMSEVIQDYIKALPEKDDYRYSSPPCCAEGGE